MSPESSARETSEATKVQDARTKRAVRVNKAKLACYGLGH